MKIKIIKDGYLHLERAGEFKEQYCVTRPLSSNLPCGDYCPLFKEPHYITYNTNKVFTMVEFGICKQSWKINKEDFIDERIK